MISVLRPRREFKYVERDRVIEHCANEDKRPEAVIAVVSKLDTSALGWLRNVSRGIDAPTIVLTGGNPAQRETLHRYAQEIGAIDCVLREELTTVLLESVLRHARMHDELRGRYGELKQRFDLLMLGSRDGLWEWDLRNDEVSYSPRWTQLFGLDEERFEDSRPSATAIAPSARAITDALTRYR